MRFGALQEVEGHIAIGSRGELDVVDCLHASVQFGVLRVERDEERGVGEREKLVMG